MTIDENAAAVVAAGAGDLSGTEAALQQLLEVERAARAAEASAAEDLHSRLEVVEKEAARAAELEAKVKAQAEALEAEARTRAELEDMLLRIERHFKAEQGARRAAEEKLASMEGELSVERATRTQLEGSARSVEDATSAAAKAVEERSAMEAEMEAAKLAQRKAEKALQTAEETVRAAENVDKMRMKHEHEARVLKLASELDRCRDELEKRTAQMGSEMERWRHQAEAAASTVQVAKQEVVLRKKEMDATKEKLDALMDKLYVGREMSIALQGAIDYNLAQNKVQRQSDQQSAMLAESLKQYIAAQPSVPLPTGEASKPAMPARLHANGNAAADPRLPPISARAPPSNPHYKPPSPPSVLAHLDSFSAGASTVEAPAARKRKPKKTNPYGAPAAKATPKASVPTSRQRSMSGSDPASLPSYMQPVKPAASKRRALHEPKDPHAPSPKAAPKAALAKKKSGKGGGFGSSGPRWATSEEMNLVSYAASRLG